MSIKLSWVINRTRYLFSLCIKKCFIISYHTNLYFSLNGVRNKLESIFPSYYVLGHIRVKSFLTPHFYFHNVCFIKNRTKRSSVLLLCLVQMFMRQTLDWDSSIPTALISHFIREMNHCKFNVCYEKFVTHLLLYIVANVWRIFRNRR